MTYDKEFLKWLADNYLYLVQEEETITRFHFVWQAARKDHYRIGEEVENAISGERAEVKAVLNFTGSITHINPINVRRIPPKSRIDEIAEEAASKWGWGKKALEDAIKSAILQARKEWEAER